MRNSHFYSCCRASTAASCHSNSVVVYSIVTGTVGAVWMSTRMKMRCRRSSRGPWGAVWSPLNRQRWVWLHLSTLPNIQRKTSRKRSGVKATAYSSMTIRCSYPVIYWKDHFDFHRCQSCQWIKAEVTTLVMKVCIFTLITLLSVQVGIPQIKSLCFFSRFWVLRGWQRLWEWRCRQFFPHVPLQKRR